MKSLRFVAVYFVAASLSHSAAAGILTSKDQSASPSPETLLSDIGRRYSLEILYKDADLGPYLSRKGITANPGPAADVESYAPILAEEWSVYPRLLVERTRLKRIILCAGLAYSGQLRTAIPDFDGDNLYLDVSRGRKSSAYVRKVIHHEFFHLIDLRDDGKLYQDDSWTALNAPGFKYGSGGASVQNDRTVSIPTDAEAGFLDKYAMSGVEEDKAETYCFLVVDPALVDKRLTGDSILTSKVNRMKELLRSFCPEMDDGFWKSARKLREPALKPSLPPK
jgi:hypothetical protein